MFLVLVFRGQRQVTGVAEAEPLPSDTGERVHVGHPGGGVEDGERRALDGRLVGRVRQVERRGRTGDELRDHAVAHDRRGAGHELVRLVRSQCGSGRQNRRQSKDYCVARTSHASPLPGERVFVGYGPRRKTSLTPSW